MKLQISSKEYKKICKKAIAKNYDCERLKDRAWAVMQVIAFLGKKEHNTSFIKKLIN